MAQRCVCVCVVCRGELLSLGGVIRGLSEEPELSGQVIEEAWPKGPVCRKAEVSANKGFLYAAVVNEGRRLSAKTGLREKLGSSQA